MVSSVVMAALVFGQLASPASRPAECASLDAPSASNVWERAKSPTLRRYCDLLASASAKLSLAPEETQAALAAAEEAAAAAPDRAAPLVLRGRALARLGLWSDAAAALGEARSRDEHALDDPSALLAWARSLARLGRIPEARVAFDALVPRASAVPVIDRAPAEIEAAVSFEARGPSSNDEAIALLRQATRDAHDAVATLAFAALALALDRSGEREEARVVTRSLPRGDPRGALADARVASILADAGAAYESSAIEATVLDERDPPAAREAWTRYLAGPGGKGPWAEHARAHVAGAGHARHPR